MRTHVAVDIGTSGGKVFAGTVGETIRVHEVHRFESNRIERSGELVWDVDHLITETLTGLQRAETAHGPLSTVGIDSTAEMFGLVNEGEIVRAPVHTTSVHTDSGAEPISREEMFFTTGHARLPTGYSQLYREHPSLVESADWLGLLPALVAQGLGSKPHGEVTYAISAGLGNTRTCRWSTEILHEAGLPVKVLPEMVPIGATVGTVSADVGRSLDSTPEIVAVPGHDTSAAVASIPFQDETRAFLATGSWFIVGFEVDDPILSREAFNASAENMGGVRGTARFVRNTPGLSLLEHCRRRWGENDDPGGYRSLLAAAREAPAFGPVIDPASEMFLHAHYQGETIPVLKEFCRETGQEPPYGKGEIVRCILESLAASSAVLLDQLSTLANYHPETLHLVGGGTRNPLLCRMIASATGTTVYVGPTEASALGSLLVQAKSTAEIPTLNHGRTLVGESIDSTYFDPENPAQWRETLSLLRELKRRDGPVSE
jgi:rhamnulokinase